MPEEYTLLFNKITDAIRALEFLHDFLIDAQKEAEELYMGRTD